MHLIIKGTLQCNFACSFCSAGYLKSGFTSELSPKIKEVITRLNPDSIGISGGDPLMCSPKFFEDLLAFTTCPISLVSNLKGFYLSPNKWKHLLLDSRISVCTSFQYGNGRKWDKNTVYTEDIFRAVMRKFKEEIGYVPPFISVINKGNEEQALKHLLLAKELGTVCRLNGMNCSGISIDYYPRYKMVDIWNQIYEQGLEQYLMEVVPLYRGNCELNTNLLCQSTIRTCWVDMEGNLIYGQCEDLTAQGQRLPLEETKPLPIMEAPKEYINSKCKYCELCNFCNACELNRKQAINCPEYCEEMLKRKEIIIKRGWAI
mgnify:CR=1 FL=1